MLVSYEASNNGCTVTLAEHGTKVSNNLATVDGLTLTCSVHGEIKSYGMNEYPKYRVAQHAGFADGAAHLDLDKPTWRLVGLAPQHRDY